MTPVEAAVLALHDRLEAVERKLAAAEARICHLVGQQRGTLPARRPVVRIGDDGERTMVS